ncbi:MAG: hypothetical protein ACRCWY_08145 [Cellulosilyticaceae bacterium]
MDEETRQVDLGNARQLYELFEQLVITKRNQRMIEERLLQVMAKPIQRKWMHERVQDQYKHEKIVADIVEQKLDRNLEIGTLQSQVGMSASITQELNMRMDGTVHNIQLINGIAQLIDDFKVYKIIMSMLSDEYIYNVRLIKILNEK